MEFCKTTFNSRSDRDGTTTRATEVKPLGLILGLLAVVVGQVHHGGLAGFHRGKMCESLVFFG